MSQAGENDRVAQEIGHGEYGPGVFDEPTTTRPDTGADDAGLSSTVPVDTDLDTLQNGGPSRFPAVATTTGGTAGPNSFRTPARRGPGVAPTTTGDATTGSMEPDDYVSDASGND